MVRGVPPDCFAAVMATGIVSVGLRDAVPGVSVGLMWAACAVYGVLCAASVGRVVAVRGDVRRDLVDPGRAFGFFTFVAGTDVIGVRMALDGRLAVAVVLFGVGGLAWLVLGYAVPWWAVMGDRTRGSVLGRANGGWFVAVVAAQSVAILAAVLERSGGGEVGVVLALVAVVCWSVGVVGYLAVAMVVAVRLLVERPEPGEVTPAYWVAMGATAITVLAGSQITRMAPAPALSAVRPLPAAVSVLFWGFGTWLIPPLLAAGWWRHVTHRVPLRFEGGWWSIVFPLGMYGVATAALGQADRLPLVLGIGHGEIWLAAAAWAVTAAGGAVHLVRRARVRV
ncbi:MAG TPA: tellurite resistance/C4-dicarboxylate transporter family protein [Streptosporangiaceae bacterium]